MIIFNVLSYLKTKDVIFKNNGQLLIKDFATHFKIKITKDKPKIKGKVINIIPYNALIEFIKNDSGYKDNLNRLFHSL